MRHVLVRDLAYTPDQLFSLVGDVQRYPQFVPWITSLRAWNRREPAEGVTILDAEAHVRFAFVGERFSTRVRLDAQRLTIDVTLLSGPFRHLRNCWRFKPLVRDGVPAGCELMFEIDFEFRSRLLHAVLAANFEGAVARLVDCFEHRAEQLYGPARSASLP